MTSAWSLPLLVAAVLLAIACGAHKADATYGVDVSSVPPPFSLLILLVIFYQLNMFFPFFY
jgi:hypothetical protein